MSIVYVVQEPMRKAAGGQWVSKGYNLAAASPWGELKVVYSPDAPLYERSALLAVARRVATAWNPEEDWLVPAGSPTLIGTVAWAIGETRKPLRILEWDRGLGRYVPTASSMERESDEARPE